MGDNINPDAQDGPRIYLLSLSSIQFNIFVRFYFFLFIYFLIFKLFFEIILDSQEVMKLVQKGPEYPSLVFLQWLQHIQLEYNIKMRNFILVQCMCIYVYMSFYYMWRLV